jgi:hypothetical protein
MSEKNTLQRSKTNGDYDKLIFDFTKMIEMET